MTLTSRHTGQTLLFVFTISYALLVAWCIFFPSDETEAIYRHGGNLSDKQDWSVEAPSIPPVSPIHFSPSASAPSFGSGSAPRKFRLRGSSYGDGYVFSGRVSSPVGTGTSGGLYTTSSAQVHSYGGGSTGMLQGVGSASRTPVAEGCSGVPAVSITPTLALNKSTPFAAMMLPETYSEEGYNAMMQSAPAASTSAGVWKQGAYYSPVRSAATTGWMSAEDWLDGARSSRGIRKEPGANTPDPIANWLASLAGSGLGGYSGTTDGIGYFDEATLKAYYESLKGSDNMPGFTWEEVKAWFAQGGDNPIYSLSTNPTPVGDAWMLLLLALGYALYKYLIGKQKRTQTWLAFGSKKDKK